MDNDIKIICAGSAETVGADEWEEVIIEITKALVEKGLADEPGFGLGGQWSYGTNFSNDTFLTHRFCWCEQEYCPYCSGCTCPQEAFWYTVNGNPCGGKEWAEYHLDACAGLKYGTPEYKAASEAANAQRDSGWHEHLACDYCRGTKYAEYGQVKNWGIPLFWHKPSGMRACWCKWLGRDTDIYLPDGCAITPEEVLQSCLESIGG